MNKKKSKKRIDQILFEKGFFESRNKAQAVIMAGQVYVNKKLVKKSGDLFDENVIIKLSNNNEFVSRGALKIEPVILNQNINIENKVCLDIGSSTGGFTQVLLKYNAKKIFAIDVGYGQLHEKIKSNKKVISFEKTNAKYLDHKIITEKVDIIVCDASFISLKKVINIPLNFLKNNGYVIALIKPQFEAKKNEVKKGGIIKDSSIHQRICNEIKEWFEEEKKFKVLKIIESSIKGPKKNKEFFIVAVK